MSNPPGHEVYLVTKDKDPRTGRRKYTQVGVAYDLEWGGISILLNTGTVIDYRLMERFFLSVLPIDRQRERIDPNDMVRPEDGADHEVIDGYYDDGEIPF